MDYIPECILSEILVRLPAKSVARFECVSRRWLALISDHAFLPRYLSFQRAQRNPLPIEPTLIFLDNNRLPSTAENFSLDFLGLRYPVVVSSYNDLVLCCATKRDQRDYYICNMYTNQWTALPPTPGYRFEVIVGFMCEPYYYFSEETNSSSSTFHVNGDYKYAIVRILEPFIVEVFSSEIGEWREYVFPDPPYVRFDSLAYERPGLPYKGKLYWVNRCIPTCMISLDPFSDTIDKFYTVALPNDKWGGLSVSQEGRLRLFTIEIANNGNNGIHIRELIDDEGWCEIASVLFHEMVSDDPLIAQRIRLRNHCIREVACDPSNDDVWYVGSHICQNDNIILKWNFGTNRVEKVTINVSYPDLRSVCVMRYMVPWWPTPVRKIERKVKEKKAKLWSIDEASRS